MAPTLVREPFHRPCWVYEEKIHGRSAATRGYVAKDEERFYVSGRTRAWLKVKVPGRTDVEDWWRRVMTARD